MSLVTQSEDLNTPPLSPKRSCSDTLLFPETPSAMTHTNVIARRDGFITAACHSAYDFKKRTWIFDVSPHSFCAVESISIDFLGPYSTAPFLPRAGARKGRCVVHNSAQVASWSVLHIPSAQHYEYCSSWKPATSHQHTPDQPPEKKYM